VIELKDKYIPPIIPKVQITVVDGRNAEPVTLDEWQATSAAARGSC
jgi:hypothetical protein